MNLFFFSRCLLNDDPNSVVDPKWVEFTALLRRNILFFSRSMVDHYWEIVAHRKKDKVAAWFGNSQKTLIEDERSIHGEYKRVM